MTHFKIVVPTYNCVEWLPRCLDSIARQTYTDYRVCVIDDASTDSQQRPLIEDYCRRYGWLGHYNTVNQGALYNIVHAIHALQPQDHDVIITLDGDDWLYNSRVLSKLACYYRSGDVYLTYGQFITYPRWNIGSCRPIADSIIEHQQQRCIPWCFGHLRTFKYYLWRHIQDADLRDSSGHYYKVTLDLAFMYPMLEMAGYHIRYIDEILYVYNKGNPLNDHAIHLAEQQAMAQIIRAQPPYARLLQGYGITDTSTLASKIIKLGIKSAWKIKRVLKLT